MLLLALDTSLGACSVALMRDGELLAAASEPMMRGHQERLGPMATQLAADAGVQLSGVERIVTTVGPGSFTGLRVGIAFAKGLALALGAQTVGIGTLQALAASASTSGTVAALIDARQSQAYFQMFEAGTALMAPDLLDLTVAAARLAELAPHGEVVLAGPGAALLSDLWPRARSVPMAFASIETLASLGHAARPGTDLRPLYLRASYAETGPPHAGH